MAIEAGEQHGYQTVLPGNPNFSSLGSGSMTVC